MLKLQWLQVHSFRSVKPGTRLSFSPTLNVPLGQNGTGKTTLLELVAAVASSDFTRLQSEALDVEYELASATGRITARVRNVPEGSPGAGLTMDLAVAPHDMAWPLVIRREGPQLTIARQEDASDVVQERIAPEVAGRLWLVLMSGGIAWVEKSGEGTTAVEPLLTLAREVSAQVGFGRFDEALGYFEQLFQVEMRLSRRPGGVLATGTGLVSEDLLDGLRKLAAARWPWWTSWAMRCTRGSCAPAWSGCPRGSPSSPPRARSCSTASPSSLPSRCAPPSSSAAGTRPPGTSSGRTCPPRPPPASSRPGGPRPSTWPSCSRPGASGSARPGCHAASRKSSILEAGREPPCRCCP